MGASTKKISCNEGANFDAVSARIFVFEELGSGQWAVIIEGSKRHGSGSCNEEFSVSWS